MKRKIMLGLLLCVFLVPCASAKENYFTNENGVSLTEKEYVFFSKLYWEGYQKSLTQEEYLQIKDMELFDQEIEKKTYTNYPITRGSSVTSNLRTLSITKVCNSNCFNTLVTTWIGSPYVRSYDVMGVRLNGPSLLTINNLRVEGNNFSQSYSNPKKFNNGFGYSFQLPNTSNIQVSVSFTTTQSGTIYGSYQHAMSNTTSVVSNQYTIGVGGYGNVFQFIGTARNIYDNAPGVDISL